jgi:hypothetical protein
MTIKANLGPGIQVKFYLNETSDKSDKTGHRRAILLAGC